MARRRRGLDSVLRLKQREEERKTIELATIAKEERGTRDALQLLHEKHHAQLRQLAEAAARSIDPMRLEASRAYLYSLDGSIDLQRTHLVAVEQRVLESKDELRARGITSPDRADALMLAFAAARRPGFKAWA